MRMIGFTAALAIAVQTVSGAALAQQQVALGSSGSGTGPYINGAQMAEAANGVQDAWRFSVQTTGGYRDNMGLVLSRDLDIALTTLIDLEFAVNGRGDFASLPGREDLRLVFTFGAVPQNLFVREDSGITALDGIQGQRFNINSPASFTHALNLRMLEAAGIALDSFEAGTVPTGQVFDQVQNGVFEGGAHVFQLGLGGMQRLASSVPMRFLDVPEPVFTALNAGYFGLLVPYTVPAGTYQGQDADVSTFGLAQVVFAHKDADPDMVYALTRGFWENLASLQASNTSFNGMTPELGAAPYGMTLHPGAARYFAEVGAQ